MYAATPTTPANRPGTAIRLAPDADLALATWEDGEADADLAADLEAVPDFEAEATADAEDWAVLDDQCGSSTWPRQTYSRGEGRGDCAGCVDLGEDGGVELTGHGFDTGAVSVGVQSIMVERLTRRRRRMPGRGIGG
jgi:hypothetical protein